MIKKRRDIISRLFYVGAGVLDSPFNVPYPPNRFLKSVVSRKSNRAVSISL